MLPLLGITLLVLLVPSCCDDTVVDDIGSHMMDLLSELLSPEECQSFYEKITGPGENVVLNLEFSEGNNPIRARRRRDIISAEQCKKTLTHWLDVGDTMSWDHLSQALQAIGRSDVSTELGENLSQEKILEMKNKVVYQKTVQHLTSSLLQEENEVHEQVREPQETEITKSVPDPEKWDKPELNVERESLAPSNMSLFGWVSPVVMGVFMEFLSSFVAEVLALYSFFWILNGRVVI